MPTKLQLQDFYSTTITEPSGIPASGDFNFTVTTAPTYTSGFIVISANNSTLRDVFYFHNRIGNRIYVRAEGRLTGNKAHIVGEAVQINDTANIFNYFSDMIAQAFLVEKTGGLSVRINGGYVLYNGNVVAVPDTTLTLTNNTINYVKYNFPSNTTTVDTADTGNVKVAITTLSGVITNIDYRQIKEAYIDFSVAITWALPSQTGNAGKILVTDGTNISWGTTNALRSNLGTAQSITATNASTAITVADTTGWTNGATITGTGITWGTTIVSFVANTSAVLSANYTGTTGTVSVTVGRIQALELDATWAEQKRLILSTPTFNNTDLIWAIDPVTRVRKEMQYSSLISAISWVSSIRIPVVFAETIWSLGRACAVEPQAFASQPVSDTAFGNVSGSARLAIPFYHSGLATTALKTYFRKNGAPTDSITIRIETDSADTPSGTLVSANATFTIWNGSLTTTQALYTLSCSSWNSARWTKLWIVITRPNAVDASNYYAIGTQSLDTRIFMGYKLYNGSVYGAKTAIGIYFESTACEKFVAILASTTTGRTRVSGFSDGIYSAGSIGYISAAPIQLISWITKNNYYSLSGTAGDLQVTPASTNAIGFCGEDGTMVVMDDVLAIPWYFYQNGISDNNGFAGTQYRAQFYCNTSGTLTGGTTITGTAGTPSGSMYIWVLRVWAWIQLVSGSRVFAWESVAVIVNGTGAGGNYYLFDWNIQFTPSF